MITRQAPTALINSALAWCPQLPLLAGNWVAGGFIRAYYAGETPGDMDIYFMEPPQFDQALKILQDKELGELWQVVFETDRAISLRQNGKKIQLIRYLYATTAESLISQFDFTICAATMCVFSKSDAELYKMQGRVTYHDDFFEHLAGRILVFQGSPLPLSSLKRAFKYVKRGYSICDENLIRIVSDIDGKIDFTSEESITQHIAGMDPDGARRIRVID